MTDEEKKSNDNIVLEVAPLRLFQILSLVFLLVIIGMIIWYECAEGYAFTTSPCRTLQQRIIEKQDLWLEYCNSDFATGNELLGIKNDVSRTMTNKTMWR